MLNGVVPWTTFKEYYNNHKRDAKYIKDQYHTELTKYNIQGKVVDKVYGNANSTMCKLTEKLWIINQTTNTMLNKKSELFNKCRHL